MVVFKSSHKLHHTASIQRLSSNAEEQEQAADAQEEQAADAREQQAAAFNSSQQAQEQQAAAFNSSQLKPQLQSTPVNSSLYQQPVLPTLTKCRCMERGLF